ncbi:MAG: hypothetical protein ABR553_06195, partial [Gammaproteobacteria bacterium]
MKRRGWIVTGALLALSLAVLLAVTALLTTERGLLFALHAAQRLAPGELSWASAEGRLIGPLTLEGLAYSDANGRYRIGRLALDWSPGRLLARRLSVHRLHLDQVDIVLPEPAAQAPTVAIEPGWSLPLELALREVRVRNLRLRRGADELVVVETFTTALSGGLEWLDIEHLHLRLDAAELRAHGRLGLGRQVASALELDWRAEPPGSAPLAAEGRLTGTWEQARLTQRFTAPVQAEAQLELRLPFSDLSWALEITLPPTALDRFRADWPAQRLGGKLQAHGTLTRAELGADLETDTAADALYPVRIEAALSAGTAAGDWRLQTLRLHQGEAQLNLSGEWQAATEQFSGHLEAQAFSWPPAGVPQLHIPTGELHLDGTPDAYRVQLEARLEGAQFPPGTLQAAGQGGREALRLERLRLETLDGVVQGQGDLAWTPQLRWDLQLSAENLDPGQYWPDWPGRLSARAHSTGADTGQGLTLSARVDQLAGTLRGYPVTGRGGVELQGDSLRLEAVRLHSGTARLELDGSLAADWALDWHLAAPQLEQLLPG